MSVVVDASVFVAACRPSEQWWATSLDFIDAIQQGKDEAAAPTLLLVECAGAIARMTRPELGLRMIRLIDALPLRLVALDEGLSRDAAELAAQHRLRGADAVYVACARQLGATLVTWDQEMLKRSTPRVAAMAPSQWLQASG